MAGDLVISTGGLELQGLTNDEQVVTVGLELGPAAMADLVEKTIAKNISPNVPLAASFRIDIVFTIGPETWRKSGDSSELLRVPISSSYIIFEVAASTVMYTKSMCDALPFPVKM